MRAVHVRTREEWDEVSKVMGYEWKDGKWSLYQQQSCINLHDQLFAELQYYKEYGFAILSFDEWKAELNINPSFTDFETNVKNWADEKGLLKPDNQWKQLAKVMEELGELSSAMLKSDTDKIKDGMGDTFVTLVILANQLGIKPMECMNLAWDEIKNQKGKNVNGTFIKEV